jgi:hypothetical protein
MENEIVKQSHNENGKDETMNTTVEAIKKQAEKSANLIWVALGFGVIYWLLEAVRDVLVFEKGDILHQIFTPDFMSFWTRFLALCILVLFGVYAEVLQRKVRANERGLSGRKIVCSGIAFGVVYWTLESVRDTLLIDHASFLQRLFVPDSMSLWMRLLAVFVIVLLSLYVQNLSSERNRVDSVLRKERDRLYTAAERTLVDISKSNNYLRIENEELRSQQRGNEQAIRIFRALFNGDAIMIRRHKLSDLLNGVCEALVTVAGFPMVAIGFRKGDNSLDVVWTAKAAQDARHLEILDMERQDYELERWPIGQTLKTGVSSVVENFQDIQHVTNWTNSAVKSGLGSLICLPLKENGHAMGTLNIFPSKEMELENVVIDHLKGFADHLAFAISEMRISKNIKS